MKRTLLISVAALALAAASNVAISQTSPGGASGATPGASGTINAQPGDATPGTTQPRGAQERTQPGQKATQERTREPGQNGTPQRQQTQSPGQQPSTQQSQTPAPGATGTQQSQTPAQPGGAKQGAAQGERKMTTSNVSLTTEQKTTIRNTVINTGPKVSTVNFDISVGTVVPRTVRVAPLPATLVTIQPAWRGYMYFIHGDEIIVVEPSTLRIVAVLEV